MHWPDVVRPPTSRQLREFAITGTILLSAGAIWRVLSPGGMLSVASLLALACLVVVVGFFRPRWLAPVFTTSMVAVFPFAWLVSHLLLAIIYFGVITPLGLAFRLIGRDPLGRDRPENRASPKDDGSHWRDKTSASCSAQYLKQY